MLKAFAELRKPQDLLLKLENDYLRICANRNDHYAAFDFFVTAEHIIDWIHPSSKTARERLRNSSRLLKITSHIANGAKHFEATRSHHDSVKDVQEARLVERGYVEEGYAEVPLIVRLTADAALDIGQDSIFVSDLAADVLAYWRAHFSAPTP